MAKFQWRYVRGFMVPQKIPTGYVLCHNHIMHTNDMHCGVNGFWVAPLPPSSRSC